MSATMRAVMHRAYGSPELLNLEEIEVPVPGDEQVLVRVRASSVNAADYHTIRAKMLAVRLMAGLGRPKEPRVGGDAAGVVEAVGANVTDLTVGDEVYGVRTGAYAEYVAGRTFVRKPGNLTFEQAAAIPIAGVTALQALRDHGGIQAGQSVLVTGAGGGVGTFTAQLAKVFGGVVTATTHTDTVELVRALGVDEVIDYTRHDFTGLGRRWDLIVDIGGATPLPRMRRALAAGGRLVIVGAAKTFGGPIGRLVSGLFRARVLRQRVVVFIAKVKPEDLLTLKDLAEAGSITPVIDRTYPLEQTADALLHAERGAARGKVVIRI